jgi:hypothetical protein
MSGIFAPDGMTKGEFCSLAIVLIMVENLGDASVN